MKKLSTTLIGCLIVLSLFSKPALTQTMNFGDAVAVWAGACGNDVETFCKSVKFENNQMASCLAEKASLMCQDATTAFRMNMDARLSAQVKVRKTCRNDIKRLCSGIKAGQARQLRCVMRKNNFRAASKPCKITLQAAGWLDNISIKKN